VSDRRPVAAAVAAAATAAAAAAVDPAVDPAVEPAVVGRWPIALSERASRSHGRRTLVKVLDAAVAELASHGFHGTRMAGIAKAAGVAHGTVYVYFADKDDLLLTLQRDVDAELSAVLLAMPALSLDPAGHETLLGWMEDACVVFQRHGAVLEALAEALSDDERSVAGRAALRSMAGTTAHMSTRIAAAAPPDLDPDIAALSIFAVIEGLNRALFRGDLDLEQREVAAELSRFVERSVIG
jgi:AcrR family transcriptional regulator